MANSILQKCPLDLCKHELTFCLVIPGIRDWKKKGKLTSKGFGSLSTTIVDDPVSYINLQMSQTVPGRGAGVVMNAFLCQNPYQAPQVQSHELHWNGIMSRDRSFRHAKPNLNKLPLFEACFTYRCIGILRTPSFWGKHRQLTISWNFQNAIRLSTRNTSDNFPISKPPDT